MQQEVPRPDDVAIWGTVVSRAARRKILTSAPTY